jgi:hypothetical protein
MAEPTTTIAVNWVTVVFSSALISSAINVFWNAAAKFMDRQREDQKTKKVMDHVYLEVTFSLEAFAKACYAELVEIDNGLRFRDEYGDDSRLNAIRTLELKFDPEPRWTELPVDFVAKVKSLPGHFASTDQWIKEQYEAWADIEEAYYFEAERLAFYGLKACKLADEIRGQISAGPSETSDVANYFSTLIEGRKKLFGPTSYGTLIPELHALFKEGAE